MKTRSLILMIILLLLLSHSAIAQQIALPSQLTKIEAEAFMGNQSFENVVLPDGLTQIGARAFANCTALKTVYIPSSVTSIAWDAFSGCNDLNFVCAWDSYAAKYASSHGGITVDSTTKIPVTVTTTQHWVKESGNLSWEIVPAYYAEGDTFDYAIVWNGEIISQSDVKKASHREQIGFSSTSGIGEVYLLVNYYHTNGFTTQVISECSQVVGELSASLTAPDPTANRDEYISWTLKTQQAAGTPTVQYTVYKDGVQFAQSECMTDMTYRVKVSDAGTYTAEATVTDALEREVSVQGDAVTVRPVYNQNDPLTYRLNEDGNSYTVIGCDMSAINVEVPSTRNNLKVTAIGDHAFMMCESLTSVKLTNNIKHIGDYAFHGCKNLTSVAIFLTLESVGEGAFSNCPKLSSGLYLPSGMTEIPAHFAEGSTSVTAICTSPNLKSIGENAFAGCTGITSLVIPDTVTAIGDGAFAGCSGITSVTFGTGLTQMGEEAFSGCTGLASLVLPEGLTALGESAFAACTQLADLTLPESMGSIAERAFAACTKLQKVTLPANVAAVHASAFAGCTRLEEVELKNIYTLIDPLAFDYCAQAQLCSFGEGDIRAQAEAMGVDYLDLSIPVMESAELWTMDPVAGMSMMWHASVQYGTQPYTYLFDIYCDGILQISSGAIASDVYTHIPEKEGDYHAVVTVTDAAGLSHALTTPSYAVKPGVEGSIEHLIYELNTEGTAYTITGSKNLDENDVEIIIPASIDGIPVTAIGESAFSEPYDNKTQFITTIVVPESVTEIGEYAFADCKALKNITLGSGVTSLGEGVFCASGIEKVILPAGCTAIPDNMFSGCNSLKEVTIPSSVTTIGEEAFCQCDALESANIPSTVTSCGVEVFYDCDSLTDVVWNASAAVLPGKAFAFCSELKSIQVGSQVTKIGAQAFRESGLTAFSAPSVTEIDQYAFMDSPDLVSVHLPALAEQILISGSAFENCTRLETVEMSDEAFCGLSGSSAFENCISLREVKCRSVWMKYQSNFSGCVSLEKIKVSGRNVIYVVPAYSFYGCTSLKTVDLERLEEVCESAFEGCTNLTDITFPTLTALMDDTPAKQFTIGPRAFAGCTALKELIFPDTLCDSGLTAAVSTAAFEGCTSLEKVVFPESFDGVIGTAAFRNCTSLKTVLNVFRSSYGDEAFKNCTSLEEIDLLYPFAIGYYVSREIGDEAFANCESLTTLRFDESIREIGTDAFKGCVNLVPITTDSEYATQYFAENADYKSPAQIALTRELSAEMTWGAVQSDAKTVKADIVIYNTRDGELVMAGDWMTAWANAQMNNVKLSVSSSCMSAQLGESKVSGQPYSVGSINYLASTSVPMLLTCTSDMPSMCDHGDVQITVSADGCEDYVFTAAAEVQFPHRVNGDLVISEPTTLSADTLVSGNVYVNDELTLDNAKLDCAGNIYIGGKGTLQTAQYARVFATGVDVKREGWLRLGGFGYLKAEKVTNAGAVAMLSAASSMDVADVSITGEGILHMTVNAQIATDTFEFDTTADHTWRLTNGKILAREATIRQNFYASGKQAFVLTGGKCSLSVTRQPTLQRFAALIVDCVVGDLSVEGADSPLGLPFECAHFGISERAVKSEVTKSNTIAKEIYEKVTTARLDSLAEAEKDLANAAANWYTVTLDMTDLTTDTLRTARQASTFAQKAVLRWALETMLDAPGKWNDCNDVINSLLTTGTGAIYTYTHAGTVYDVTVKPLGGLTVSSASASAGTIICTAGEMTFQFVYTLSPQGIRENGEALLEVMRKYAQEDFVKYLNKALEEAMGKENAKYALAVVKVVETGLIEEKGFLEVIADKYGKDIAKKLIEQKFPQLKETIKFVTKWEKFIKQTNKVETLVSETRNGSALPSELISQFLKLPKLIP